MHCIDWINDRRRVCDGLASATAGGVCDQIERAGVAEKSLACEDLRVDRVVTRVKADLHAATAEPHDVHFESRAANVDRVVAPDGARDSMPEGHVEVDVCWKISMVAILDLFEIVTHGFSARGRMRALVILAGKPSTVHCVEVLEVIVLALQFDANLGSPSSVPALDRSLGLRISRLGVEKLNTDVWPCPDFMDT